MAVCFRRIWVKSNCPSFLSTRHPKLLWFLIIFQVSNDTVKLPLTWSWKKTAFLCRIPSLCVYNVCSQQLTRWDLVNIKIVESYETTNWCHIGFPICQQQLCFHTNNYQHWSISPASIMESSLQSTTEIFSAHSF